MQEVLPGVLHWVRTHPRIQIPVSSYYFVEEATLLDPLEPEDGTLPSEPRHILLTNRHHYRDSGKFVEKYGAEVWCVGTGLHEFTEDQNVRAFSFGDELPGGVDAVEIGALCPDETALFIRKGDGIVAIADGVVRDGDGPLSFVPDDFMGDDPEAVKAGLKAAYRRLCERDFDHLLLAHGAPWISGGKHALREFVDS